MRLNPDQKLLSNTFKTGPSMKYIIYIYIAVIFILFIPEAAVSQGSNDTLEMAKKLRDEGNIAGSMQLLTRYSKTHSQDLNTLWLLGNTAYISGNFRQSAETYHKAVQLFPENYILKLDFAKILTSLGKLSEAEIILKQCLLNDKVNIEAGIYLALVYSWQVRYTEAIAVLDDVLKKEPSNTTARELFNSIRSNKSPLIQAGIGYNHDDQPMNTITPWIRSNFYTPKLHQLAFILTTPNITGDTLQSFSAGFSAGNQFLWHKTGLGIYAEAGIFTNPSEKINIFTANLKLEKTILRKINLTAGYERKPYYLTLYSANTPLPENHAYFSASIGKDEKWGIKAGVDHSSFSTDNNGILTLYSWIISPALKAGVFGFRMGYGFNYSNSDKSTFESKYTIEQMIADSIDVVDGIYNPYFTPKNTQVHSLFGIVTLKPARNLMLSFKYTYGVMGVSDNPYLFLKEKGNGSLMVSRQFAETHFNPYEFTSEITYTFNSSFSLTGHFKAFKTLYYESQFAGLSLRKKL
ncbi:MAG: tetratricopeptide repeat protein [Bacteroidales bacterium]